jgi:hypothetical protein
MRVPDGVREIAEGLENAAFGDPFSPQHRNTP